MELRLLRPRDLALALRGLARRRPDEAEEYLDTHPKHRVSPVEADPPNAAGIVAELEPEARRALLA